MTDIIGKWVQAEGQPYAGLWFEFKSDGSFEAQYEPMGIVSSGTFTAEEGRITMQQTTHTLGLTGVFKGLYDIDEETMKMALASGPGQEAPEDLSEARVYQKA